VIIRSLRNRLLLALAIGFVMAGAARSQTDDERAAGRAAFERGLALYDSGDRERALAQFRESYRLNPTAVVVFDMGVCLEELGRLDEALAVLQGYLVDYGETTGREDVAEVRARVARIEAAIAQGAAATPPAPPIPPAPASPQVPLPAPGPPVAAPANVAPAAPAPDTAPAADQQGGPATSTTTATATATATATNRGPAPPAPSAVEGPAAPVASAAASVEIVASVDYAVIEVDGREVGRGSVSGEALPGTHDLVVRADGYETHRGYFEVQPAENRVVRVDMVPIAEPPEADEESWYEKWWVWTLIGIAVAGGATAGVILGTRDEGARFPDDTWIISGP
jgi:hypothetical protein